MDGKYFNLLLSCPFISLFSLCVFLEADRQNFNLTEILLVYIFQQLKI